jgi:hypothetical protein
MFTTHERAPAAAAEEEEDAGAHGSSHAEM